jgi:NAD(P)-dependent dehydrogenase (short-subunit alcohol dehydrogenase family)
MREVSFRFDGRAAIVTGGASGIGRATAQLLAAAGARVAVVDIDGAAARDVARSLPDGAAIGVGADVSTEAGVASYVAASVEAFGGIDLFANNAGLLGKAGPLVDAKAADYELTFGVNLKGAFLGLRDVLRQMLAQGRGGAIVCTASIAGLRGVPNVGLYSASKFGLIGLTRSAAKEYGGRGIRINAICPAATETKFSVLSPEMKAQMATLIPLGRVGEAEDMARAVVWLLSDGAGFVNGAILPVDGGQTA